MNIRTILFLLVAAAVALPLSAQERRPVYIVNGERYEGDAFREIPPAEIERMETPAPIDEPTGHMLLKKIIDIAVYIQSGLQGRVLGMERHQRGFDRSFVIAPERYFFDMFFHGRKVGLRQR